MLFNLIAALLVLQIAASHHNLDSQQCILQDDVVDTTTLQGKFLYGYQGWFRKPGEAESDGNTHWSKNGQTPGPGNAVFDFFPYVNDYPAECLFDTLFTFANGTVAQLFTNTCIGVIDKHFQWMQEYGIDGVFVQRFYGAITAIDFLVVLGHVQKSAEKYGRGFAVQYDLSGANSSTSNVTETVLTDWEALKPYINSTAYLHHDGKPVVELWGFGLRTGIDVSDALTLSNSIKAGGAFLITGTESTWRSGLDTPGGYGDVYRAADVISPWTIGSYNYTDYPNFYTGTQVPDFTTTASLGIQYAPVIWPGTSHANGDTTNSTPYDGFPRYNGSFFVNQAEAVLGSKPFFIYAAMWDEVNEGTGCFSVLRADELPTNQRFVGIDHDMDRNYYLALGGKYAALLHAAWT